METTLNNSPSHDPALLDLARISEAGSDRGPFYDKGIKAVIEEIVNRKGFVRSAIRTLILSAAADQYRQPGTPIPTAVQEFLDANGWSLAEGIQFAQGIDETETQLTKFRVDKFDEE